MIWQDFVLSLGGLVGVYSNAAALWYTDTEYPRRSSIPKATTLGATATAFLTLGLTMAATVATVNVILWAGIVLWRAPESDDNEDDDRRWMKQIRYRFSQ